MANFKRQSRRLLSVALALIMMLSAIPFVSFAADEAPAPEYVYFGTYSSKPLKWLVLSKEGGKLLLITDGLLERGAKYNTASAVVNFETSTLYTKLNGSDATSYLNSLFTAAERAKLLTHDVTYYYWNTTTGANGTKTTSAYITIPSKADVEAYGLGAATVDRTASKANYWLADARANSATDKYIINVTGAGAVNATGTVVTGTACGVRPMILVDAAGFVTFTAADGATFTNTYGDTIANATLAVDAQFKVVLDENYNQSAITVKANDTALTATDGVYTIPAGAADTTVTLEGVTANPADFTAYNQAKEAALALNESDYTTHTWDALQEALAVDVSSYGIDKQAEVDAAAAAINTAISALVLRPADFTAFDAAYDEAQRVYNDTTHYNSSYIPPEYKGAPNTSSCAVILGTLLLRTYKKETVHNTYTIRDQATVDAATQEIIDATALFPVKMASTGTWAGYVAEAAALNPEIYMNVPEFQARVDAIVAEHDYVADPVDSFHQDEVDASASRINAIIMECKAESNFIPSDFTNLDNIIAIADTYLEENFYKDDDPDIGRPAFSANQAWDEFVYYRDAAKAIADNKETYNTKFRHQAQIDSAAQTLQEKMEFLDQFARLSWFDKTIRDTKFFFGDVYAKFVEISNLLKGVFGLLKALFNGDIDIFSLLETVGVDDPKLISFLEKIGFKHKELNPETTPTVPQEG